ncbi:NUDIX hydrolase [Shewanella xiamenensis]|uniref:NUDIX hydrolase n=1 Tax=Shewanella xiamenensis TaxID=332186 RepID=UPI001C4F1162|nr:NUDIX domain-containing protein [Shewanella xiamenensis]MBW0279050.1 NUDIX hydrolase [Shewanella xiamenensis]MCT8871080.1 NUDIX domain-containing protein [Shewanella xiamenensis]UWH41725.1 NUDIX domain-containing protein [Shewanella xiamenensis]
MAFEDRFRLSSHAVITNELGQVLLLKANYGNFAWGLPGGALELGETIHEALLRECQEELGLEVNIHYLSGVYYHSAYQSQAFIFRCEFASVDVMIRLSHEHSEFAFHDIDTLSAVQQQRVKDCLNFNGAVVSAKF